MPCRSEPNSEGRRGSVLLLCTVVALCVYKKTKITTVATAVATISIRSVRVLAWLKLCGKSLHVYSIETKMHPRVCGIVLCVETVKIPQKYGNSYIYNEGHLAVSSKYCKFAADLRTPLYIANVCTSCRTNSHSLLFMKWLLVRQEVGKD